MKSHKLTILMPNSFNSLSLITIGVCIKKKWAIYERIEKNYKVGLEKKKKKKIYHIITKTLIMLTFLV